MPSRPKHSTNEIESVLREAERKGWRIDGGGNSYFKMKCPCPNKHLKTVHLTPQQNYAKNLRRYLKRQTCWEVDGS